MSLQQNASEGFGAGPMLAAGSLTTGLAGTDLVGARFEVSQWDLS
jgi:hypothetical protein